MDKLLEKIYNLSPQEQDDCVKHVMLGGGTPGPTIVRGKGIQLQDVEGKWYIDCTSQSWAMYLGFSHPEINQVTGENSWGYVGKIFSFVANLSAHFVDTCRIDGHQTTLVEK